MSPETRPLVYFTIVLETQKKPKRCQFCHGAHIAAGTQVMYVLMDQARYQRVKARYINAAIPDPEIAAFYDQELARQEIDQFIARQVVPICMDCAIEHASYWSDKNLATFIRQNAQRYASQGFMIVGMHGVEPGLHGQISNDIAFSANRRPVAQIARSLRKYGRPEKEGELVWIPND